MKSIALRLSIVVLAFLPAAALPADDPFGAPPKGASPNCGPEARQKFDVRIGSTGEFAGFLKSHAGELKDVYGNPIVQLDDFKISRPDMTRDQIQAAPVDWDKVKKAVAEEKAGGRIIYRLDYSPVMCTGQYFTVKMTGDGHVSIYGCCGK